MDKSSVVMAADSVISDDRERRSQAKRRLGVSPGQLGPRVDASIELQEFALPD
jgi:hypothetical protein